MMTILAILRTSSKNHMREIRKKVRKGIVFQDDSIILLHTYVANFTTSLKLSLTHCIQFHM